jgi:hypothetical protein
LIPTLGLAALCASAVFGQTLRTEACPSHWRRNTRSPQRLHEAQLRSEQWGTNQSSPRQFGPTYQPCPARNACCACEAGCNEDSVSSSSFSVRRLGAEYSLCFSSHSLPRTGSSFSVRSMARLSRYSLASAASVHCALMPSFSNSLRTLPTAARKNSFRGFTLFTCEVKKCLCRDVSKRAHCR